MSYPFDTGFFDYEILEGVVIPIRVTGSQSPKIADCIHCHPDSRTPAEGGELYNLYITNQHGALLPSNISKRLMYDDNFLRTVDKVLLFYKSN